MANQAVRIYDHQKQPDGKWKFIPVDFEIDPAKTAQQLCYKLGLKGRLRKGNFKLSWYEGAAKKFEPGSYPRLEEAVKAAKFRQVQLQGKSNGIVIENPKSKDAGRMTIDIAAAAYLRAVEKEGRPGTFALAKFDLDEFQKWNVGRSGSKRTFVDQITKDDLLDYRNMIVRSGRAPRTAVNKVMRVNNFVMTSLGLKPGEGPIKQKDAEKIITKPNENDVDYYSEQELEKFFPACDHRQHLIFSTFLYSGCRREEIEFLYWDDLDLAEGELKVRPKPEFDFTVKTKQERSVTLPPDLVERLKAWKERATTRLVFPTKNGGPLGNSLLVSCKRAWKRAGLNCGTCRTCLNLNECERAYLHKFRATYATMSLQRGMDLATLQEQLGHETLEATVRYLGTLKKKARREKVTAVWATKPHDHEVAA